MTKIKLGDKIKTLVEHTEETSHGPSTCPKGIVGYVIDDSHYPDLFIEIKNTDGEFETFGYGVDELELIK